MSGDEAYGLWVLVALNTGLFVVFAASFFHLQWPTIPTLVMFPVLAWVYRRLAVAEEREVAARFGPQWAAYAARTPRFVPRPGDRPGGAGPDQAGLDHAAHGPAGRRGAPPLQDTEV